MEECSSPDHAPIPLPMICAEQDWIIPMTDVEVARRNAGCRRDRLVIPPAWKPHDVNGHMNSWRERQMLVPKEMVVECIRAKGYRDVTERAERELPEKVDPERHADLLRELSVDPQALLEEFRGQSPEV